MDVMETGEQPANSIAAMHLQPRRAESRYFDITGSNSGDHSIDLAARLLSSSRQRENQQSDNQQYENPRETLHGTTPLQRMSIDILTVWVKLSRRHEAVS